MIRLFLFLLAVLALGFGFAWFADRPGEVTLVWQGNEFQTSLMVVLTGLVVLVAGIMITWWVISVILRSPALMRRFYRNRQRDRGYYALSQGLIAASSGDAATARRLSKDSRKLLGEEPLVQLLDAQTLLLEGNRDKARERFTRMLEDDDTRLVALRGLYLEAERQGEKEASRHYAEEAAKMAPALPWAGNAVLKHQSAMGDWEAALRTLESNRSAGLIAKDEAARKRAVLLTAQAMAEEQAHPDKAAKLADQAHKLAPGLVPAAVVSAAAHVRLNELRKAANILEAAWKRDPHPDIAQAYVHLRHGDSGLDKLKRAKKLASMRAGHPEGAIAVAEAAMSVGDWTAAREAMKPVLLGNPGQRACTIMADIEEGQYGDKGRMRDWLARAVRAPRDAVWVADGYVSAHWLPISPITGEVDAFEWKVPVAQLGAPLEATDLEDLAKPMADDIPVTTVTPMETVEAEVAAEAVAAAPEPLTEPAPEQPVEVAAAMESAAPAETAEAAPEPQPVEEHPRAPQQETAEPVAEEERKVFPLRRPPDDPGVDPDEPAAEKKAFRLF